MIVLLDQNLNSLAVLVPHGNPINYFYDDVFKINIDGSQYLTFKVPFDIEVSDFITVEGFVIYKTVYGKQHILRITNVESSADNSVKYKQIECESVHDNDLEKNVVRPDVKPSIANYTFQSYMSKILTGTEWSLGTVSLDPNVTNSQPFIFDTYKNSLELMLDGLEVFGLYAEYVVMMNGTVYVGKKINVFPRTYSDPKIVKVVPQTYVYDVNVKGISRVLKNNSVVNSVIPLGKASNDTVSERLTINTGVSVPSAYSSDFYVYNDMLVSRSALQRLKGKYLTSIVDLEDTDNLTVLMKKSCEYLEANKVPQARYDIDINTLEEWSTNKDSSQIYLNDYAVILDKTFNPEISIAAKCVQKCTSWTKPDYNSVSFDNVIQLNSKVGNIQQAKLRNAVKNRATNWESGQSSLAYTATNSNGGKATVLRVNDTRPNTLNVPVLGQSIVKDYSGITGWNVATGEIEISTADHLRAALAQLPKYIHKRIIIRLKADITGVFVVEGFYGSGEIIIAMDTYSLFGSFNIIRNTVRVGVSATSGKIQGNNTGQVIGGYTMNGVINIVGCTETELSGIELYGGTNAGAWSPYGLNIINSNCIVGSAKLFNCQTLCLGFNSTINFTNCNGKARNGYAIDLYRGSYLGGSGTVPEGSTGTTLAAAIRLNEGSTNAATFTTAAGTIGTNAAQYITRRFTTTAASSTASTRTWDTNAVAWRTDNNHLYQGEWTTGVHNIGCMFFQSDIRTLLVGKTVSSMYLYLTRMADAGIDTANIVIVAHTAQAYTAGNPTSALLLPPTYNRITTTLQLGEAKWIDISNLKSYFTAGTAYGLAVYATNSSGTATTTRDYYAKISSECIVEATYI